MPQCQSIQSGKAVCTPCSPLLSVTMPSTIFWPTWSPSTSSAEVCHVYSVAKRCGRFRQLQTSRCCLFKLLLALPLSQSLAHVLQLLLLYVAGGLAGSLAHVTQYYIQAQSTGKASPDVLFHACFITGSQGPHATPSYCSSIITGRPPSNIAHCSIVTQFHMLPMRNIKPTLATVYCTALHCSAPHCIACHCTTALHSTALHRTALHCTPQHCTQEQQSLTQAW